MLGEGAIGLWLEPAGRGDAAARRGEILGVAASSAALPLNAWPDRPEPLERTMRLAIEDAGLAPADVDVVYASGNATRELDACEAQALDVAVRRHADRDDGDQRRPRRIGLRPAAWPARRRFSAAQSARAADRRPDATGPGGGVASARASRDDAAPGPIVLVNSFASGGALFSVVLRVRG